MLIFALIFLSESFEEEESEDDLNSSNRTNSTDEVSIANIKMNNRKTGIYKEWKRSARTQLKCENIDCFSPILKLFNGRFHVQSRYLKAKKATKGMVNMRMVVMTN